MKATGSHRRDARGGICGTVGDEASEPAIPPGNTWTRQIDTKGLSDVASGDGNIPSDQSDNITREPRTGIDEVVLPLTY
jgi:hypothetical protein